MIGIFRFKRYWLLAIMYHMKKKFIAIESLKNMRAMHVLTLIILSIAVYLNALQNGFVYDDTDQVLRNPWIKDIANIPAIFSTGVWGFQGYVSNYYRPVMHLLYMLDYHLFGFAPWGFHLVNIILHTTNCVLVFLVTERLLRDYHTDVSPAVLSVPFMAAVIFAVHPVHTEAVTWVAGVPDLSYVMFFLLAFYLYIGSRREGGEANKWFTLLSVASFFVAMLCKEPAITLPAILLGFDYAVDKRKDRLVVYFRRYLPYLLAICVYLFVRSSVLGGFSPDKPHWKLGAYLDIVNTFPLFSGYLGKLFLPLNLNFFYVFHPASSVLEAKVLLSVLITAAFVVVLFASLKKRSLISLALILIVVPLLPVMYIPGLGKAVFTERYLYLPVFGFALLLPLMGNHIAARRPSTSRLLAVCFIGLIAFYSVATISRNRVWKDDYTLFSDTVRKSPDGALPHDTLGVALFKMGRVDEAITEHKTAIRLEDDSALPHVNLAAAYISKDMLDDALNECNIALKLEQENGLAYNLLGVIYGRRGQTDKAIEMLQTSITINSGFAQAHNNLGIVYGEKGLMDKAVAEFQAALNIEPGYAEAHSNLGITYNIMGQTDKAVEQFRAALRLDPNDAISKKNLNEILQQNNH